VRPVLFDSSVYISALRTSDDRPIAARRFRAHAPVWLSSVVLEELYAGTRPADIHIVERLERDFEKASRILVPNLRDWTVTGQVLSRLAVRYGYEQIGRGRLTNDALIAMSAARAGITVITANERDFARLAEFRGFQWQVSNFWESSS
jgi:predicted nucleic acid-binding protein